MKAFIGVTDNEWFSFLRRLTPLDEVNFWQPSGKLLFKALKPGELFLFKLHNPYNYITGGGVFAHSSLLPISLAWESFEEANGARNLFEMRKLVEKNLHIKQPQNLDYTIGCILLEQPFFLSEDNWIPAPSDWQSPIVKGKGYDLTVEPGFTIWKQLQSALVSESLIREDSGAYGQPVLVNPRLGQGSFRVLVTDAYERRCAVTRERTLPALDAAHIKPFSESGLHSVNNGILLRKDLHALFDKGYITVSPSMNLEVSRRIKEEYENGRDYYRLDGEKIWVPVKLTDRPSKEFLEWHNSNIYLG